MKEIKTLNDKLQAEHQTEISKNGPATGNGTPFSEEKLQAVAAAQLQAEKLKDVRAARKAARYEFKLNNKPIPYIFQKNTLLPILQLSGPEKEVIKQEMLKVQKELESDKHHKAFDISGMPNEKQEEEKLSQEEEVAVEGMLEAEEKPLAPAGKGVVTDTKKLEKDADLEAEVKKQLTSDKEVIVDPVLAKQHNAIAATKHAMDEVMIPAVQDKKNQMQFEAKQQALAHHNKLAKIGACVPRPMNMEYLTALRHQVADFADDLSFRKDEGELIGDEETAKGGKFRRQVQSLFIDTCRHVPAGVAGSGIDGFIRVNEVMKEFFMNQLDDISMKANGDLQGRIDLEIKRAAKSCVDSDKNKKLGAEDTTSACYKQVLYRVKGIIAEHNSPAKQVKPIADEGL